MPPVKQTDEKTKIFSLVEFHPAAQQGGIFHAAKRHGIPSVSYNEVIQQAFKDIKNIFVIAIKRAFAHTGSVYKLLNSEIRIYALIKKFYKGIFNFYYRLIFLLPIVIITFS